jgi:hypothetical protein
VARHETDPIGPPHQDEGVTKPTAGDRWHQRGIKVDGGAPNVFGMRRERGILIKSLSIGLLGLALAGTAACGPVEKPANASTNPTPSAGSGFGKGPASPTPAATTATANTTKSPSPKVTKVKTRDWAKLVKKCPNAGQKVEIQKVLQADVTQDGIADTLVTRGCEASTSYWPSTIEIFDGETSKRYATLLEKDVEEPVVTGVTVTKGVITVKAYATSLKGTKACPDLLLTSRWQYVENGFEELSRVAEKKKTTC